MIGAAFSCLLAVAHAAPTIDVTEGTWSLSGAPGSAYASQQDCVAAAAALAPGAYTCAVGVTVTLRAAGSATLAWSPPSDGPATSMLGFHVWKVQADAAGDCPRSGWAVAATVGPRDSSAAIAGLVNGVRWCFKVTTYSTLDDSEDSYVTAKDVP